MVPHSSTLAWKIPWMEEPGGLQSMGLLRVGHDWATSLSLFHFHAMEKEMATHSSVLAWRIPGTGEPGGLPSMGSQRVGHDWATNLIWSVTFVYFLLLSLFSPYFLKSLLSLVLENWGLLWSRLVTVCLLYCSFSYQSSILFPNYKCKQFKQKTLTVLVTILLMR